MSYLDNYKWTYNWRGKRTGWDYKLSFTHASQTPISYMDGEEIVEMELTEVELPQGAISGGGYSFEYDDYPLGMHNATELNIVFNIKQRKDGYTDFLKTIFSPFVDFDYDFNDIPNFPSGYSIPLSFKAGTICKLEIKYNGNDETTPAPYRTLFIGMQKEGFDTEFSPSDNTFSVSFIDINRCILEAIPISLFEHLWQYESGSFGSHYNVYESYYQDGAGNTYELISYNPKLSGKIVYFWFDGISRILSFIELFVNEIYRKLTRYDITSYTVSLSLGLPEFYRQTYDQSGDVGSSLSGAELYLLCNIADAEYTAADKNNSTFRAGVFWLDGLKDYSNIWDFFVDLAESNLKKFQFGISYLTGHPYIGGVGVFAEVSLPIDVGIFDLRDIKFSPNAGTLKRTASSLIDSVGDDINRYEIDKPSGRGEEDRNIPILLNNIPLNTDYRSYRTITYESGGYITKSRYLKETTDIHSLNIYYKTDLEVGDVGESIECYMKAHDHCRIYLGSGIYSDDAGVSPFDGSLSCYPFDRLPSNSDIQVIQQNSCLHNVAIKSLSYLFNSDQGKQLSKIEAKCAINKTNSFISPFLYNGAYPLKYDLNLIEPIDGILDDYSSIGIDETIYFIIKSDVDIFFDETSEFTAISKVV